MAAGQERSNTPGGGGQKATPGPSEPENPSRPPTLSEIADDWGVSLPYVSKCKNQRGCPVDSLEAARKWRDENTGRGHGYRAKKKSPGGEPGDESEKNETDQSTARSLVKKKSLRTMEASLKASIAVEEECLYLVQRATSDKKEEKLPLRIMAYNKAKQGRLESEKRYQEYLEASRVLVPLDEAKALIKKGWGPMLSRLRAVAKTIAPLANPENDVVAEQVIREAIEKAISEGCAEYESAVV